MNGTHLGSESAVQGEGREIQQLLHPVKVAAHTYSHTYASENFQPSKQLICAIDGFMGRDFTSGGQESGSAVRVVLCKTPTRKCYIKSLPSLLKDKRSCCSQAERSAIQLPPDHTFALQKQHTYHRRSNYASLKKLLFV